MTKKEEFPKKANTESKMLQRYSLEYGLKKAYLSFSFKNLPVVLYLNKLNKQISE